MRMGGTVANLVFLSLYDTPTGSAGSGICQGGSRAARQPYGLNSIPQPAAGRSTVRQQRGPCPPTRRQACPLAELYLDLVSLSSKAGEVDQRAPLEMRPQQILRNPEGRFQLFRIGDAVASRNIHAAV